MNAVEDPASGVAPPARYTRAVQREGRLPVTTKLFQAFGALPGAVKDWAFNTFLLLFYNQVLGLPASWAGVALMIAVFVDAITDPAVGSFSDGLVTKWGRRHPLMYASIVPMALTLYLLFSPPAGLGQGGLFIWLLAFAIGSRVAMTFFAIPWAAMFPELTDDYVERSEVLAWRYGFGIMSVALVTALSFSFIFPASDGFAVGQLNPSSYARFAPFLALLVAGVALATTLLTHREIKYIRQPVAKSVFSVRTVIADLFETLRNRNFLLLFIGLLFSHTLTGTVEAMRIYLSTYFWGFTPDDLRWFALAALGAFAALFIIPYLNRRFDKRTLLIATMTISILDGAVIVSLRFLDILPPNGDPMLLRIILVNEVFRGFVSVIIGTMFISMVADTIDEQELRTGQRQEGVFSAAIGFSGKAISGFGILIAGLLLDLVIGFPQGAQPDTLAQPVVTRLGLVMGYLLPFLYFLPLMLIRTYRLSRAKHAEILDTLAARGRAGDPPREEALLASRPQPE